MTNLSQCCSPVMRAVVFDLRVSTALRGNPGDVDVLPVSCGLTQNTGVQSSYDVPLLTSSTLWPYTGTGVLLNYFLPKSTIFVTSDFWLIDNIEKRKPYFFSRNPTDCASYVIRRFAQWNDKLLAL